jgi:uncharacterized membrane protein YfcA
MWKLRVGYALVALMAVYGGFFSGGYVVMIVAVFTFFFGYRFLQAVALARNLNAVSSLVASTVLAIQGAIDWRLAGVLGVVAFSGSFFGAKWARQMPERWLRRVFVTAVAVLAAKALLLDLR